MSKTHQTTYDAIFSHPIDGTTSRRLKHHHPDIARQVVGTVIVDRNHLTEDQLLAQARELYTPAEENWHGMPLKT
jgi:hypothetical protein